MYLPLAPWHLRLAIMDGSVESRTMPRRRNEGQPVAASLVPLPTSRASDPVPDACGSLSRTQECEIHDMCCRTRGVECRRATQSASRGLKSRRDHKRETCAVSRRNSRGLEFLCPSACGEATWPNKGRSLMLTCPRCTDARFENIITTWPAVYAVRCRG